jgi:hypothetical protein
MATIIERPLVLLIQQAYEELLVRKDEAGRSPKARTLAIAVTHLEDAMLRLGIPLEEEDAD